MLTIGLILGPVGLLVGLLLAASSQRWNVRQKLLVLVIPAALVLTLLLVSGGLGSYGCSQAGNGPEVCDPHPSLWLVWSGLAALVGTAAGAVIFLWRAARRAPAS